MERYEMYVLDKAHNAATGIDTGEFEGMYTQRLIAKGISTGGGDFWMQAMKQTWYRDQYQDCHVYWRAKEAWADVQETEVPVILVVDTNQMRPARLKEITFQPLDQFWPNGASWDRTYSPVCCRCYLNIFEGEEIVDGCNGYKEHRECPGHDSEGNVEEECVQTIEGFVLTKNEVVRGIFYRDLTNEKRCVSINNADIRRHMTAFPDQYLNKRAAFSFQSITETGAMNRPTFLGLIGEEKCLDSEFKEDDND